MASLRSRAAPMTTHTETIHHTAHPERRHHNEHRVADVPLALWPVGQVSPQYQRAGRYDSASAAHPGKMLPALAGRIVAEYSTPGSIVLDAMAGIGTTLVEAAQAGRRAIGVELEPRWAAVAESNCDLLLDPEHRGLAEVIVGDARRLDQLLGDTHGHVDLVCTSPPYACDVGQIVVSRDDDGKRHLHEAAGRNYSTDKANLGHARGPAYEEAIAEIYAACFAALRPGGLLVTVTKNTRRQGRTLDLAALTVALCEQVGFTYVGHVIALHAGVRDSGLVGRPSFWQTTQVRKARSRGEPASVVVHEDVCCFAKGTARLGASGKAVRNGK
jgi:modification methylase